MSASPPEKADADQAAQSGDEQEQQEMEGGDTTQGLGDFEVKEQDRWLPIANGWCSFPPSLSLSLLSFVCLFLSTRSRSLGPVICDLEPAVTRSSMIAAYS